MVESSGARYASRETIKSIECIGEIEDYVYDISMADQDPFFFANDILVHNTDSTYFSAWPAVKKDVEAGEMEWNKELVVKVYDKVAEDVSDTFPQFMLETFNVPVTRSEGVIKSGREIVAETGLYIKKKRYAALVYDSEGTRVDNDGKPGKVKAMGLDLRRSDTPKFMQEFLSEILLDTLTEKGETYVIEKIKEFKKKFNEMKPWEKGTPKAVNNLTSYREREEIALENKLEGKPQSLTMPGHVRASLNWNNMLTINKDMHTGKIVDGQKIIVCKLQDNHYGMTSIAYPIDEAHLPEWFINLPFDNDEMMGAIVDKKIENLLWVLNWDLSKTNVSEVFEEFFSF